MLHYSETRSSCTGISTGFTELEYVYFDMNHFLTNFSTKHHHHIRNSLSLY